MKNDTQLKVQAYLDNELSPGDARRIASLISSDSAVRDLYSELKDTKETIRRNEPEAKLSDSPDFYWSQIQRRIAAAEKIAPARTPAPWWVRVLAPLAGAVALFAILFSVARPGETPLATASGTVLEPALHEVEDLAPDVSTITFRSEAEGVTVVWVTSE
jgi:anti-sigma factor RsiW